MLASEGSFLVGPFLPLSAARPSCLVFVVNAEVRCHISFYHEVLIIPFVSQICRAVVARGMATEKQSESVRIHYCYGIVHLLPSLCFHLSEINSPLTLPPPS